MIEVRYCNIGDISQGLLDEYLAMLPPNLRDGVLRYRFLPDRAARLVARLLVRNALGATGFSPELLASWEQDANGKPFITGWSPFNISHSNNIVVIAYSGGAAVGIDVESIETKLDLESMLGVFGIEEQMSVKNSPQPHDAFLAIWVKKEAVLKAMGKGIGEELNKIDCRGSIVNADLETWYLQKAPLGEGYLCFVATSAETSQINVREVSLFELNK